MLNYIYTLEVEDVNELKNEWLETSGETELVVGDRVIFVDRVSKLARGAEIIKRVQNKIKIKLLFYLEVP